MPCFRVYEQAGNARLFTPPASIVASEQRTAPSLRGPREGRHPLLPHTLLHIEASSPAVPVRTRGQPACFRAMSPRQFPCLERRYLAPPRPLAATARLVSRPSPRRGQLAVAAGQGRAGACEFAQREDRTGLFQTNPSEAASATGGRLDIKTPDRLVGAWGVDGCKWVTAVRLSGGREGIGRKTTASASWSAPCVQRRDCEETRLGRPDRGLDVPPFDPQRHPAAIANRPCPLNGVSHGITFHPGGADIAAQQQHLSSPEQSLLSDTLCSLLALPSKPTRVRAAARGTFPLQQRRGRPLKTMRQFPPAVRWAPDD